MVGATKHWTKADEERGEIMYEIGCLPCAIDGWNGSLATIQHTLEGGQRPDDEHQKTYPSCPWHHQGIKPSDFRGPIVHAERKYGPSLSRNSRAFAKRYGTEKQLVLITDGMVRMVKKARLDCRYFPDWEMGKVIRSLYREIVKNAPPSAEW